MTYGWQFKEASPGDRARESQVEKFFNSDAVANRANAIVREGIQNSLDASSDGKRVVVRIAIGEWTSSETSARLKHYMKGFSDHFESENVQAKVVDPPRSDEAFRYLVFEDYGTSGLEGDPAQWWPDEHGAPNPFFNYFRAEGISDKTEGSRGRHGVGRLVFMFASRVRSILALTRRRKGGSSDELIMGTAVLRNHWMGEKPYLPDGWFGIPDSKDPRLMVPIQDDSEFAARFRRDFNLTRENERGLSVVVPWLHDDVTMEEITRSVLSGYYYPILQDKLNVELEFKGAKVLLNAETISTVLQQTAGLSAQFGAIIALAKASLTAKDAAVLQSPGTRAPKWETGMLTEEISSSLHSALEAGELMALRVPMVVRPKGHPLAEAYFRVFMQRDPALAESQVHYIREGIIVTDARPRRTTGVRALVIVEEGPLATFLGDSENPSHTQWQKELVKDKYVFAPANIEYVVQSVPSILAIISQHQKKPESTLLIDLFSLPSDDPRNPRTKEKKDKDKAGVETTPPVIRIPKVPKPYLIEKRAGGFVVKRGDPEAERPRELAIKVAYGVRHGNPFTRYRSADFRLGAGGIEIEARKCEVRERGDNWMVVRVDDRDFEIGVTGFDTQHRDLHIDVKARKPAEADYAETA